MTKFLDQFRNENANKKLAEWDDSLSVGIHEIDLQHKDKIDHINTLYNQMMAGTGHKVIVESFAELSTSIERHLRDEEALMTRINYPELTRHRQEHDAFSQRLQKLKQTVSSNTPQSAAEVLEVVVDWLGTHILKYDMDLAEYIKEKKAA